MKKQRDVSFPNSKRRRRRARRLSAVGSRWKPYPHRPCFLRDGPKGLSILSQAGLLLPSSPPQPPPAASLPATRRAALRPAASSCRLLTD